MSQPLNRQLAHPRVPDSTLLRLTLRERFAAFMSQLVGVDGKPLAVADHHERWCALLQASERLVLVGPRSHGKSTTVLSFILWEFVRHAQLHPPGAAAPISFRVLLLSATQAQAEALMETFRSLLLANAWFLGEAGPQTGAAARRRGQRWSRTGVRLASGAELKIRPYGAAVRGAHPHLLVLDDVEDERTTGSSHQREQAWRYFTGVLLPMRPERIVVIGTPVHEAGLLCSLAPDADGVARFGFAWHRFRAYDEATDSALWPEQVSREELLAARDADPRTFSREFQGEPIDDASSLFPYTLTDPLGRPDLTFVPAYRPAADEYVILGLDLAVSESAGADYTVAIVCAWNWRTQRRRLLTVRRVRGLTWHQQLSQLRELCASYTVSLAMVETVAFQKWLYQESLHYPETAGRVLGHRTGIEKADLLEGIPALKIALEQGLWELPTGDTPSATFFALFQDELSAFGWRDGKLRSVAPHDDIPMALWFCERGIRLLSEWRRRGPAEEIVTGEDLGIERVHISPELDALDDPLGFVSPAERAWLRYQLDDQDG